MTYVSQCPVAGAGCWSVWGCLWVGDLGKSLPWLGAVVVSRHVAGTIAGVLGSCRGCVSCLSVARGAWLLLVCGGRTFDPLWPRRLELRPLAVVLCSWPSRRCVVAARCAPCAPRWRPFACLGAMAWGFSCAPRLPDRWPRLSFTPSSPGPRPLVPRLLRAVARHCHSAPHGRLLCRGCMWPRVSLECFRGGHGVEVERQQWGRAH